MKLLKTCRVGWVILVLLLGGLLWLALNDPPKPVENRTNLSQMLLEEIHTRYWHELLALYQPPREAFTQEGWMQLRNIQENYSECLLPYLVQGSVLLHTNMLWNPFHDCLICLEVRDRRLHHIYLADALLEGQQRQSTLTAEYWECLWNKYMAYRTFPWKQLQPYTNLATVGGYMLKLGRDTNWPARIHWTNHISLDLYYATPQQAIYIHAQEPGLYVITQKPADVHVFWLPPYMVQQVMHDVKSGIERRQRQADYLQKKSL